MAPNEGNIYWRFTLDGKNYTKSMSIEKFLNEDIRDKFVKSAISAIQSAREEKDLKK